MTHVCTIYEDDEIAASFLSAESADLLITFGDLATLWSEGNFYGRSVAEKLSLSTLGIMAKKPNWYPCSSIVALEARVRQLLTKFRHRTLHGSSMGGYACVKYSALFAADTVISFSPQWSISPLTTQGHASGWESHFTSTMTGMEIAPTDVGGKVYIFADPYDKGDKFHRRMISEQCRDAVEVDVFGASHSVSAVLAGTSNFDQILKACIAEDLPLLRKVCNAARRRSDFRAYIVADRALSRHPKLVATALLNADASRSAYRQFCRNKGAKLLHELSGASPSKELAEAILPCLAGGYDVVRLLTTARIPHDSNPVLRTCHGTSLFYDPELGRCFHGISTSGRYVPLSIQFVGRRLSVGFRTILGFVVIAAHGDGSLFTAALADEDLFDLKVTYSLSGLLCLKSRNNYVAAEPNGSLICNRSEVGTWESFTVHLEK